jgi:hypothetical protein
MVVLTHRCLEGFFGAVRRQLYSLSFCGMTARAFGTTLRTATFATALILGISASPAGAHGVEITTTIGGSDGPILASLELTDETGEICLTLDRGIEVDVTIETLDGIAVVELGNGFGPTERCQFLEVDSVNKVLADVNGHQVTVFDTETGQAASGQLAKPAPPVAVRVESDSIQSDSDDTDSSGVNVPLVFGVGAGIGVAIAVIRKRLRSR